jgi:hypothetical protein
MKRCVLLSLANDYDDDAIVHCKSEMRLITLEIIEAKFETEEKKEEHGRQPLRKQHGDISNVFINNYIISSKIIYARFPGSGVICISDRYLE